MLLSRLSELSEGGRATHRGYEVRVAEPSLPARGDDNAFAVVRKIGDVKKGFHGIWVELSHHGAHGNLEHKILTVSTVFARALAMGTTQRSTVMLEAVVDERREARRRLDHHIATATAVTAVGTALRHMGLTAKRHAASSTVTAADVDTAYICELRHFTPFFQKTGDPWLARRPPAKRML